MVIVKLIGGLGNQLFQYALGRAISVKRNVTLKLDLSWFEAFTLRPYELKHFNVIENIASAGEVGRFGETYPNGLVGHAHRAAAAILPDYFRYTAIVKTGFPFDPGVLEVRGNLYLDGYWQSEKYFKDVEDIIRKEFTVKYPPDEINARVARHISGVESVCLHVRRGDYVSDPATNEAHGVCPPEYYAAAVAALTKTVVDPHFFVFTDDPDWARDNLRLEHPITFVTHNGVARSYEDLRLMSLCHHFIVANSSFSWWGAWLSQYPAKRVFAPRAWFRTDRYDTRDLIPDSWCVI